MTPYVFHNIFKSTKTKVFGLDLTSGENRMIVIPFLLKLQAYKIPKRNRQTDTRTTANNPLMRASCG